MTCVFSCCSLLRFWVVVSVGFCSVSPLFPCSNLLLRHLICNVSLFCFCSVHFACSFIFSKHNSMLMFLLFMLLVFFGRVTLASFMRFALFLPCRLCRLTYDCQCLDGVTSVCDDFPLFAFFLARLLMIYSSFVFPRRCHAWKRSSCMSICARKHLLSGSPHPAWAHCAHPNHS